MSCGFVRSVSQRQKSLDSSEMLAFTSMSKFNMVIQAPTSIRASVHLEKT